MIPFAYTATAAAVSGLGAVGSQLIMRPVQEIQNDINNIKSKEQLEVNVVATNSYTDLSSFASYSTGPNSGNAVVGMSPYTTNILKVFAPIEFAKTDSNLYNNFILYHELSHTELNNMIKQRQMPFKPQFDSNQEETSKAELGVSNLINGLIYNSLDGKTAFIRGNFHEQFSDTYASMLIIRNKSDEYSDEDIKQVIKSRYHAVKNQEEFLWGVSGSLEHRTENSLDKVLNLDFDKIRSLSPSEVKELSLKIASNSSIEKFQNSYQTLFSPYLKNLDAETANILKKMEPDNSFLNDYIKQNNTAELNLNINLDKINSLEKDFSQHENSSFLSKIDKFLNSFNDDTTQSVETKKYKPS